MLELPTIPGLSRSSLELLEATGFRRLEELAEATADRLTAELEKANRVLKIAESSPEHEDVAAWIQYARERVGVTEDQVDVVAAVAVDYEKNPKVISMLNASPLAIPLPPQLLKEQGLAVPEITPGLLLNRYVGDLDVRVEKRIPQIRAEAHPAAYIQTSDRALQSKLDIDVSRIKSVQDIGPRHPRNPHAVSNGESDRVALIRAPLPGTNEGVAPESRRFVRGVLHNHPVKIYAGAFLTLLLMALAPVAVSASLLLLLSREKPQSYAWVPEWWLVFPLALPVIFLAWLIWASGGNCRICGQKLFVHRTHLKNAKAHYVAGLGYVLPLCVHIILFRWFRCSHCGTPVRLKK